MQRNSKAWNEWFLTRKTGVEMMASQDARVAFRDARDNYGRDAAEESYEDYLYSDEVLLGFFRTLVGDFAPVVNAEDYGQLLFIYQGTFREAFAGEREHFTRDPRED